MNPIEKLTIDQWQSRIEQNKVYRSLQCIKEVARQFAEGARTATVISGPAGIGKTWFVEQALKDRGIRYQMLNVASGAALIEALSLNPKGVFVFDECDAMLTNVSMINVLKRATDTKVGDRVLDYQCRNPKLCIPKFVFSGRIALITNMDLRSPKLLNDKRLGPHIQALNDRCEPYVMSFDHREIWEYSCYLAIAEKMLMHHDKIDRETTNEAMRYFTETMWQRDSVSPRALTLIAREIKRSPAMWRQILEEKLHHGPTSRKPIPLIPQLPDPKPRIPRKPKLEVRQTNVSKSLCITGPAINTNKPGTDFVLVSSNRPRLDGFW